MLELALAECQMGFLVDEIGGGLHYSVQTKMWEFLMTLAKELKLQILPQPTATIVSKHLSMSATN